MRVDGNLVQISHIGKLEAVNRHIQALLNGAGDMADVAESLAQFGRSDLADFLTAITASEVALEALAAASYLHGNGFIKIPLAQCMSHTLRLHVWRPGVRGEENLHSHRWPFASAVLAGEIMSEIWEDAIGDDAVICNELFYRSSAEALEPAGECRVRLRTACRYREGDRYWLSADELHRITDVGSHFVVTLTVHPRNTRSWARNILLNNATPDATPQYQSATMLRPVLEAVVDAISGLGTS